MYDADLLNFLFTVKIIFNSIKINYLNLQCMYQVWNYADESVMTPKFHNFMKWHVLGL